MHWAASFFFGQCLFYVFDFILLSDSYEPKFTKISWYPARWSCGYWNDWEGQPSTLFQEDRYLLTWFFVTSWLSDDCILDNTFICCTRIHQFAQEKDDFLMLSKVHYETYLFISVSKRTVALCMMWILNNCLDIFTLAFLETIKSISLVFMTSVKLHFV